MDNYIYRVFSGNSHGFVIFKKHLLQLLIKAIVVPRSQHFYSLQIDVRRLDWRIPNMF
jgi:hypothetical protein